jgi:hypothetical protein
MTYSDTTDCGSKGKSFKKEFRSSGVQGGRGFSSARERSAVKLLELLALLVLLELLFYEISNSWKFRN